MKKVLLLLGLLCIPCADARDWSEFISQNVQYVSGFFKPHNEQAYKSYKAPIDILQGKINDLLKKAKETGILDEATKKSVANLQKQQDALLTKATKDDRLDSYDITILQEIVTKQQTIIGNLLDGWDILYDFWEKNASVILKSQANANNPYRNNVASLTRGDQLANDETSFLKNRQSVVKKGLGTYFKASQEVKNPITIGYVAPGGGYRALILASGYLSALEDTGLLDATSYISALSGGTWFLMTWLFSNGSIRAFQQAIAQKIKNKKFNVQTIAFDADGYITSDYLASLVADLWPKFLFNQSISSVDIYGSLLSRALLNTAAQGDHLTDVWNLVKDGKKPFPLCTSVCMYNDAAGNQKYSWNEFTPLEVRNLEYKLSIPNYAFGSMFDAGKSKEIAPQQLLGYLMGTFGSAYLVDLIDIQKFIDALKNEAQKKMNTEATQYLIAATLVNLISVLPMTINTVRVLPSLTNNPFKHAPYADLPQSLRTSDQIMYVDAGIDYNIPVLPLLRGTRNVNAIIIGDTSGDNPQQHEEPGELGKFFKDAQRLYGYTYKRVDDGSTPTLRLYKDMQHEQAPRIIYINFVRDDALLRKAQSDPALKKLIAERNLSSFDFNCINYTDGFCRFFNFDYTLAQFQQLSGIAEFNIKANELTIKNFLNKEFNVVAAS